MPLDFVGLEERSLERARRDIERDPPRLRQHLERSLVDAVLFPKVAVDAMTERRGLADIQDIATRPKHAIDARRIGQCEPNVPRHRPYAPPALPRSAIVGEPFLKHAPGGNAFVAKQAHQLSPDECCGFYVICTATQSADPATEVPGEGTYAAAGQIG